MAVAEAGGLDNGPPGSIHHTITEPSFLPPVLPMPGYATTCPLSSLEEASMHGLIYLIGLIVVIMFILSLLGLR
jgi:hypothetical protein